MVFSYLDHPADVYVHVSNGSMDGVFEDAALATFEVMIDVSQVGVSSAVTAEIDADDIEQLLYKWVDRLLYFFDAESFAVGRTQVMVSRDLPRPSLTARIFGEPYDPKKHGQKVAVKAMTYSMMQISREGGVWEVYFVLDI